MTARIAVHRGAPEALVPTYDERRGSAASRGYGRRWQKARAVFLASHPLCECAAQCGRAATVVDHRQPHRGDPVLFWAQENWQALSKPCHDAKTATEGPRPWGGGSKTT